MELYHGYRRTPVLQHDNVKRNEKQIKIKMNLIYEVYMYHVFKKNTPKQLHH